MFFFFFNDTATTEIYTLSLHDALPISSPPPSALASVNAITGGGGLLQPHHHAVGGATAIDHGEPHEAGSLRLEEQRAPSRRSRQRLSVDQHGQRPGATRHLERDRIGLA